MSQAARACLGVRSTGVSRKREGREAEIGVNGGQRPLEARRWIAVGIMCRGVYQRVLRSRPRVGGVRRSSRQWTFKARNSAMLANLAESQAKSLELSSDATAHARTTTRGPNASLEDTCCRLLRILGILRFLRQRGILRFRRTRRTRRLLRILRILGTVVGFLGVLRSLRMLRFRGWGGRPRILKII